MKREIGLCLLAGVISATPQIAVAQEVWAGSYTSRNLVNWTYRIELNGERASVRAYGERAGNRYRVECREGRVFSDKSFQATCEHTDDPAGSSARQLFGIKAQLAGSNATMSYRSATATASVTLRKESVASASPAPSGSVVDRANSASKQQAAQQPPTAMTKEQQEQANFIRLIQKDLREIQQILKDQGMYDGSVDGEWGPSTERAISRWQLYYAKPVTGRLSAAEIAAVKNLPRPAAIVAAGAGSANSPSDRDAFYAMPPADVSAVQQVLINLGYFRGEQNGKVGKELEQAVRAWQVKNHLPETGYMTLAQVDLVKMQGSPTMERSTPSVPPTPTISQTTSAVSLSRDLRSNEVNDTNRFLLEGPGADVVAIVNVHPNAPHASINLRGDIAFKGAAAEVCAIGTLPLDVEIEVAENVATRGATHVQALKKKCVISSVDQWDIAVGRRSEFLAMAKPQWDQLDKDLRDGMRRQLFVISDTNIKGDRDARAVAGLSNQTRIMNGSASGWGFLLLESDSSVVCVIANGNEPEFAKLVAANEKALRRDRDKMTALKTVIADAESAFGAVRKKQCGIVLAAQDDLRTFITALRREKIEYRVAASWLTPQTVESAIASSKDQKAAETQAAAEASRNAAATRELRRQRDEAEGVRIKEETDGLRKRYGAQVAGLVADLKKGAGDAFQMSRAEIEASPNQWYSNIFPQFIAWAENRRKEGWESVSQDVSVVDFGQASWRRRTLDLILVRTTGTIRNRAIGEYKDFCFYNAYVVDPEFKMLREPFMGECDRSSAQVDEYLKGLAFQSRWNAK